MIQITDRIRGALSLTPMSKPELAKRLSVNINTIASAVNRMARRGKVRTEYEKGHRYSGLHVGRPAPKWKLA